MSHDAVVTGLAVLKALLGIYGCVIISAALGKPGWYVRCLSPDRRPPESLAPSLPRDRWLAWLRFWAAFLGVIVLVWAATYCLVDWIPYDWGRYDEDDIWVPTRQHSRIMITFFAAPALYAGLERAAWQWADLQREREHATSMRKYIPYEVANQAEIEAEERLAKLNVPTGRQRTSNY